MRKSGNPARFFTLSSLSDAPKLPALLTTAHFCAFCSLVELHTSVYT